MHGEMRFYVNYSIVIITHNIAMFLQFNPLKKPLISLFRHFNEISQLHFQDFRLTLQRTVLLNAILCELV